MRGKLNVRKPKNSLKVVQHMIKKRKNSLGLPVSSSASHKQYQPPKIIKKVKKRMLKSPTCLPKHLASKDQTKNTPL